MTHSSNDGSSANGNDPQRWNKFLDALDDKLQLSLLEYMRRVQSYHFEEEILYIQAPNQSDFEYLSKDATKTQIQLLAHDSINTKGLKISPPDED